MRILPAVIFFYIVMFAHHAAAQTDAIYEANIDEPVDEIYQELYKALEAARFYVIFEANIGKNLARNAEKWGAGRGAADVDQDRRRDPPHRARRRRPRVPDHQQQPVG